MAYVQITDNGSNNLSGLGLEKAQAGYWGNRRTRQTVWGTAGNRPAGNSADWAFFSTFSDAQRFAATGQTSGGSGGSIISVPVKPPVIGGGAIIPPTIPIESRPEAAHYRIEGNRAYPLDLTGANAMPPALTGSAGYRWTKRVLPIETYGFVWEWKFVPAPEDVVIGPPIVSAPPPIAGDLVTIPGGNRPNIVPPPPGSNVYPIGANDSAGQYYNITTGEVRQGRRVAGPQAQSIPAPPVQWFSYPPDDSGNWIVRDEAVRQGFISMTGYPGQQTSSSIPSDSYSDGGAVTNGVQQAGMSPWLIGGLALGALFLFSGKGSRS